MKRFREPDDEDRWGGVIIPAVLALFGWTCIITRHAVIPGSEWSPGLFHMRGRPAVAAGLILVGMAGFLHFRYFWASLYDAPLAMPGQVLSATVAVGSLVWLIVELVA